jgi:hypothetical protein
LKKWFRFTLNFMMQTDLRLWGVSGNQSMPTSGGTVLIDNLIN